MLELVKQLKSIGALSRALIDINVDPRIVLLNALTARATHGLGVSDGFVVDEHRLGARLYNPKEAWMLRLSVVRVFETNVGLI